MTVSADFRQAAYAAETGRVVIALLTLTHEDLETPIRISSDPTQRIESLSTAADLVYGTVSRGETFVFLPMTIKLPSDTDEGPGDFFFIF